MRTRTVAAALTLGILLVSVTGLIFNKPRQSAGPPQPAAVIPIAFEPNRGQADSSVEFLSRGQGFSAFFRPGEAVLQVDSGVGAGVGQSSVLSLRPMGTDSRVRPSAEAPTGATTNYMRGTAAPVSVPTYGGIRYQQTYPGIDWVFHDNNRRLEHDFVVAPGAEPDDILVEVGGAEALEIGSRGQLLAAVAGSPPVQFAPPTLYQMIDGQRRAITGRFRIEPPNRFGFEVDKYDPQHTLVIDPTLMASSYLGGTGVDNAVAVTTDGQGNVYVAGFTASSDYPAISPLQGSINAATPGRKKAENP
ncbi:MAG: SBBP repeat-containing protein [Pseudonocardiaceae bacterium]